MNTPVLRRGATFLSAGIIAAAALTDGDLVMLHSHVTTSATDHGTAADILRLENGKIVEHLDVLQAVPETSANDNTMF
ncbi:hypothetical protein ACFS5L_19555 [Streptomyces phyllanthi]|uniref:Uncharacterized protein n=1 Tax=Streptomyces phyllanthi TaxID=1803180 RepID=A0A5N8VVG8_9ACTN|nr:hypothetical protein [Streptomyces phyllanthi]MPY39257.1 hypothetical protein [Streptomyces phyllanthi]